jgi:hypothetical protein
MSKPETIINPYEREAENCPPAALIHIQASGGED